MTTMTDAGSSSESLRHLTVRSARDMRTEGGKPAWPTFQRLARAVVGLFQAAALDTRGSLLLESMIAITVFAIVGGAVLSGTSTALNTGSIVEGQSVAEELARNQMESVFNESYQEPAGSPYTTIVPPARYAVSVAADEYLIGDVDIEMVVVTVSRDSQSIMVLETLRTRWD